MTETRENIKHIFQRLALADDQALFWKLHSEFFPRLFRLIYSITNQREASEELTNDVFVQVWQTRKRLTGIDNPEVYLFVCARNAALAYLKSLKNKVTGGDDIQQFDLQLERTPEDILTSSEMINRINACIKQLPPQCKLIFILVKENNLKYREVAEILDLSLKTVEAQMSIALKKLSQSIPFSLSAFS